jgi:hypothetical protein
MAAMKVMIELPEALVERATAVGLSLDEQPAEYIDYVEAKIRRREAARDLRDIMRDLQALPDELKPTPTEIEAEIRAYWAELRSRDASGEA